MNATTQSVMQELDAGELDAVQGGWPDIGGTFSGLIGAAVGWGAHAYVAEVAYMYERYGIDATLAL